MDEHSLKLEMIARVARNLAHELRNTFATLSMGSQGFIGGLESIAEALSEEQAHALGDELLLLKQVSVGMEHEIRLANAVLNLLLMNVEVLLSKNLSIISEQISINDLINKLFERYPLTPNQHELIHWEPEKNENFLVGCSAEYVLYALFNVLKNAFYALRTVKNGKIFMWVDRDVTDSWYQFHIKNTGVGINKDQQSKIFELFYSTKSTSLGLGLSFCQYIMEHMGGHILCESDEATYTDFIFQFPI